MGTPPVHEGSGCPHGWASVLRQPQPVACSPAVAELIRCGVAAGVLKASERTSIADAEWVTVANGVVARLKELLA